MLFFFILQDVIHHVNFPIEYTLGALPLFFYWVVFWSGFMKIDKFFSKMLVFGCRSHFSQDLSAIKLSEKQAMV